MKTFAAAVHNGREKKEQGLTNGPVKVQEADPTQRGGPEQRKVLAQRGGPNPREVVFAKGQKGVVFEKDRS